jgi:hypothetical protein
MPSGFERCRNAKQGEKYEDLGGIEPAGECAPCQQRGNQAFADLANLRDAAAVVTVGGVACGKHQQRRGNELHQPDQAELKSAASQFVDLPAHRDGGDLVGIFREAARSQKAQERAVAEQAHAGRGRRRR